MCWDTVSATYRAFSRKTAKAEASLKPCPKNKRQGAMALPSLRVFGHLRSQERLDLFPVLRRQHMRAPDLSSSQDKDRETADNQLLLGRKLNTPSRECHIKNQAQLRKSTKDCGTVTQTDPYGRQDCTFLMQPRFASLRHCGFGPLVPLADWASKPCLSASLRSGADECVFPVTSCHF